MDLFTNQVDADEQINIHLIRWSLLKIFFFPSKYVPLKTKKKYEPSMH